MAGHDVEDITQEAHLRIHGGWPKWEVEGPNRGWVPTVVGSVIVDSVRYRHCRPDLGAPQLEVELADPRAEDPLEELFEVDRASVLQALEGLKEGWRAPMKLFLLEGWSLGRIAEELGSSPQAVSKRVHRGIEALQRRLRTRSSQAPS